MFGHPHPHLSHLFGYNVWHLRPRGVIQLKIGFVEAHCGLKTILFYIFQPTGCTGEFSQSSSLGLLPISHFFSSNLPVTLLRRDVLSVEMF